jgi:hypothetical protein
MAYGNKDYTQYNQKSTQDFHLVYLFAQDEMSEKQYHHILGASERKHKA